LVPCKKWKKECRNLEVGDVVFMFYPASIKDDYRLARVVETFPDDKGLVRTVRVCYRRRDKREKIGEYKSKPLTEELVGVQRLSVLIPNSEQISSPTSTSSTSPCYSSSMTAPTTTLATTPSPTISTKCMSSTPINTSTPSHTIRPMCTSTSTISLPTHVSSSPNTGTSPTLTATSVAVYTSQVTTPTNSMITTPAPP
jgi:hypothetical protein